MKNLKIYLSMVTVLLTGAVAAGAGELTPLEVLGKHIFYDTALSATGTQACASCHTPETGFTGPNSTTNFEDAIYQGALPNRFGNRKPPTASYAGDSPLLSFDTSGWSGGMFWDGRATGAVLGDPLAEQAQGPFLNPLEHALATPQMLCTKVKRSSYAGLFEEVWGNGSLDCAKNPQKVFEKIARSIAAYERSTEVSPFSSKFDDFWDKAEAAGKDVTKIKCGSGGGGMGGAMGCPGGGTDPNRWTAFRYFGLSDAELQGLAVFNDPTRADCASCHSLAPGSAGYPLFTDFSYDNLGLPKNPSNPFYTMPLFWNPDGADWVDLGLGGYLKSAGKAAEIYEPEMGKHKVPTLRNVDLRPSSPDFVKAYGHNGFFKSLDDIVMFYHWRAMMNNGCGSMGGSGMGGMGSGGGMGGGCEGMADRFPPPEVEQNLAELKMFPQPQIANVVLFLKTLSDGYYQK